MLAWEARLTEVISAKPAALVYSDTGSSRDEEGALKGMCDRTQMQLVLAWEVRLTEVISAKPAALVYSDTGSSRDEEGALRDRYGGGLAADLDDVSGEAVDAAGTLEASWLLPSACTAQACHRPGTQVRARM